MDFYNCGSWALRHPLSSWPMTHGRYVRILGQRTVRDEPHWSSSFFWNPKRLQKFEFNWDVLSGRFLNLSKHSVLESSISPLILFKTDHRRTDDRFRDRWSSRSKLIPLLNYLYFVFMFTATYLLLIFLAVVFSPSSISVRSESDRSMDRNAPFGCRSNRRVAEITW